MTIKPGFAVREARRLLRGVESSTPLERGSRMASPSHTMPRHRLTGRDLLIRVALAVLPMAGLLLLGPAAESKTDCFSQCIMWNPATQPTGQSVFNDSKTVELGLQFHSDIAGTVIGVRFYKDASFSGTHLGHLWSNTGTMLGEVTFTAETASGWQQANFATPVAIPALKSYWVSFFGVTNGNYTATPTWTFPSDNPPLHATESAFHYFGGFPDTPYPPQPNYWVDVAFQKSGDTSDEPVASPAPAGTGAVAVFQGF